MKRNGWKTGSKQIDLESFWLLLCNNLKLTKLSEEMKEFLKTSSSMCGGFLLKILQWLEFPIDEIKIEKNARSGAHMCKVFLHLTLRMLQLILIYHYSF